MARRKPVAASKPKGSSPDPNVRGLLRDILACLTAAITLAAAIVKFFLEK